jgi:Zn-dependent protease with chaperone function
MNFFEEQERARVRLRTFKRNFYLTVLGTAFVTAIFLFYLPVLDISIQEFFLLPNFFYLSSVFWIIFFVVLFFILGLSRIKMWRLNDGGEHIAKLAGAQPLAAQLSDIRHQQLKNVVEEMSIAAGILPPKIFLMHREPSINAFAAGFSMHDAVIGISEGCLQRLTREELQGVVAHEIGHIVNGDMKLNLELIGYLFGLTGIAETGRFLLFGRSDKAHARDLLLVPGLGLIALGGLGYFLGLLLKFKISRGQEFAADVRAVQFTRNPEGIGSALSKILEDSQGLKLMAPKAHQLEHMYLFYPKGKFDPFSTHPPLEDRIKKILPSGISKKTTQAVQELPSAQETPDALKERAYSFFRNISVKGIDGGGDKLLTEMDIILSRLRALSDVECHEVLIECKRIMMEDKVIIPKEILCYTLFNETLIKRKSRPPERLGLLKTKKDTAIIMSFLAQVSSASTEGAALSFTKGMKELHPTLSAEEHLRPTTNEIVASLERCRDLAPLAQQKLLKAAQVVIDHEMLKSFDAEVFMKVLRQVMGVPV